MSSQVENEMPEVKTGSPVVICRGKQRGRTGIVRTIAGESYLVVLRGGDEVMVRRRSLFPLAPEIAREFGLGGP